MSVASRNPFAILDAEDPERPSTPESTPKQASQPSQSAPKSSNGPVSRGGKYYQRGGGTKSAPRDSSGNLNQNGIEEPVGKKFDGRGRGRGSSRGGGRGGRGRQFDKHSQTGKTDSDKKIHQSWGGDDGNTEFKTEQAATQDAAAEGANEWGADTSGAVDAWGATDTAAAADEWGSSAPTGAASGDVATPSADAEKPQSRHREVEEEDNTLTLDQYRAQQEATESLLPQLEGRKISGEDWKDVVPIQKGNEDSYFVGKTKTAPKARAKKEEKVFVEIEPRFERPARGGPRGRGGDRGDRRGGRGGRGGFRGGRGGHTTGPTSVDVDDETAFPSLS